MRAAQRAAALAAGLAALVGSGLALAQSVFGDGFEGDGGGCGAPAHFAAALSTSFEIHVATGGSDGGGDGSPGAPYATLTRAAQDAAPGAAIVIHAGTYAGGVFLGDLRGTAEAPIWIGGAPGEARPVFVGGVNAIQFSRPAFLVLHDLAASGASGNGFNLDDGGDYADATAAQFVAMERLDIRDIGSTGNQDCLKISGLNDFWILDSDFGNCGDGGSGVDFVGAHRGVVHGNRFVDTGSNAVQAKGGSSDIDILANRLQNAGPRGLNMGGSTGLEFFRPPLSSTEENAEARRIRAVANLILGSQAPFAFVGCVDCAALNNTVVEPERWLLRILQETLSQGGFDFAPARDGLLQNNLFLFRRSAVSGSEVNVGANTEPDSFAWRNNLFYAIDAPEQSQPTLPGLEEGSVSGLDPQIAAPDYAIGGGSPAAAAGATLPPGTSDFGGACFADPPSIGAWERP